MHGQRGSDPTEPPSDHPYPFPSVRHEPRIQEVVDGMEQQGLKPFPLPVGVRLDEQNPLRSLCIKCDTFDGFSCLVDAKYDLDTTCIRPILDQPNVTLVRNTMVTRLETDASGRNVSVIHAERNGEPVQYRAAIMVVAAGAVKSAALRLRSASERHPNGLANGSDQVGRSYMAHNNSAIPCVLDCSWTDHPPATRCMQGGRKD